MGGGYGEWGESLLNTANINMSEINSGFERWNPVKFSQSKLVYKVLMNSIMFKIIL